MSMTWKDYLEETLEKAQDALEMDFTDYYFQYNGEFSDIFSEVLRMDDNVTGCRTGSFTCNYWKSRENISDLIWDYNIQDMIIEYGYTSFELPIDADEIDVMFREIALEHVYDDLEDYFNQLVEEKQDELAPAYIEANSNLCQLNAYRALEYLSEATDGAPMELAEKYTDSLYELKDETPDQWMKAHPHDTLITDPQGILPAFVITDETLYL